MKRAEEKENPMQTFGQVLKDKRKAKGRTLDQVARACDTHKGYISGIENGKVNAPAWKVIRRLCRYLELDFQRMVAAAWWEKRPPILETIPAHEYLSEVREAEAKAKADEAAGGGAPAPLEKAV